MLKADKDQYDAVIIGAGMSGLVCGCYLAKAGMKVLIAEQHHKPGGYCSSFKRKGFTFDAAAHCFGGYRKDGITRKVFKDLEIDKRLKIKKVNLTNIIRTPDYKVSFWSDFYKTIKEFQKAFPEESNNIKNFFCFVSNPDPNSFSRIRSWTLKNLLDQYFTNDKLKTILAAPLLGIGGLPPSLMSAFMGAKLFSEFLLDGGYHPESGMQALPDALAERFQSLGGDLRLSSLIKKIKIKNSKVKGIVFDSGGFIPSKYVISNCDARQTFLKLLGRKNIEKEFFHKIKMLIPSISNFILYLGLDGYFKSLPKPGTTLCFFPHYDIDMAYQAAQKGDIVGYGGYMLYVSKDTPTILSIIPAPFKNKRYWDNNKYDFLNSFIDRIEKYSIPDLSKHIIYKEAATPNTLYRYTLNYRGASFGWAGTPSQLALSDFSKPSFIQGLYLTGHWTTLGIGISGVVHVGFDTAKKILRKEKLQYTINT
jgi:phytoene dehydrogenase-like protein